MSLFPRSQLVRALSLDSQARLTNDVNRPARLGFADGVQTIWDTPFLEASTLKGSVDGVPVTGTRLSRGTGADGVDQVVFPVPPAEGATIAVSADALAIDVNVLEEILDSADSWLMDGVQSAGYEWPLTGAALLAVKNRYFEKVKVLARKRRDLPVAEDEDRLDRWLYRLATGETHLRPGTRTISSVDKTPASAAFGSDEPVFTGDPL